MTYIVRCSPLDKGKHIDILKIMYLHIRFYKKEKKMSPIGNSGKKSKKNFKKIFQSHFHLPDNHRYWYLGT